ncbi:BLUF domain-containing protein [Glaciecola sp. MF2-115]|uniref:BLUF domain-containing protein n=1 Tax=Glaciecola sp. MF2-115 TaxID=3384827 RepID=UPI0039A0B500
MSNLFKLSYISKNSISGDKQEIQLQIESILKAATKNNIRLGITGALLYSGGYFCQVIEGEEDCIEELFETIQQDSRHTQVTVLNFETSEKRSFSEWAMAFAGIEDSMRFDLDGIRESKDLNAMKKTGKDLVSVLATLVKNKQASNAP